MTLVIGAVTGLVVVAFILLTENLGARLYPGGGAAWRRLLIPVAGALGTGFFLARYFPNARGSGIPQTKTALFLRDGYISMRTVLGKFSMCSVTLASGIALGREGPSVQVSSGLASVLGRRLGLSNEGVKALVPVGASAALAAAFNTPIAAVLFTLEEVMGDLHAPVLGSIVLSSATSWMVLHLLLGDEPLFHVPAYQLVHPVEFLVYAALGVAGGLVSVAFVKLLLWQRKYFLAMSKSTEWFQPVAGGLLVGILGWFVPEVLGVGYGFVGQALNGQMVVGMMALLVLLKVVATATCYASGNAGGIFGPSLFMGAMTGGAIGGVAHMLMPDYTGSAGAYALVGMGALFAGIIRVPLTSVIMIFEITRDYTIIVPLMIANLISYYISMRMQEEPIYEALQHQDGIRLPAGARAREAPLTVGSAYRMHTRELPVDLRISQAWASVNRETGAWPVIDAGGLRGMVTADQLEEAVRAQRSDETLAELVPEPGPIDSLTDENFPHVHVDHPLDAALRRLAASGLKALPVVSRADVRKLHGTISVADILTAYESQPTPRAGETAGAAPAKISPRMIAGLLASMVMVAVVIAYLNYSYRAERMGRGRQYFQAGNELMAKERYDEAVEQYRNALSITHGLEQRLALGLALTKTQRFNEASIYLNEVLKQRPESGRANLGMARISAQQGQIDTAVAYYQRAIYGSWPERQGEYRMDARMELVDLLSKAGRRTQAQAELLAMAGLTPDSPAQEYGIGHKLIDLGMPAEAADLFRGAVERSRQDGMAYQGLGDAEFALGNYGAAREAFRHALKIDPGNAAAGARADLCGKILALDPTQRRIGAEERYRRSQEILKGVLAELLSCAASADKDQLQAARAALARRRPPSYSDAADSNLTLAEALWVSRLKSCQSNPAPDDPLARVMAKLAR